MPGSHWLDCGFLIGLGGRVWTQADRAGVRRRGGGERKRRWGVGREGVLWLSQLPGPCSSGVPGRGAEGKKDNSSQWKRGLSLTPTRARGGSCVPFAGLGLPGPGDGGQDLLVAGGGSLHSGSPCALLPPLPFSPGLHVLCLPFLAPLGTRPCSSHPAGSLQALLLALVVQTDPLPFPPGAPSPSLPSLDTFSNLPASPGAESTQRRAQL